MNQLCADPYLGINEVLELVPWRSRMHIYRLVKAGKFPPPIKLTDDPQARNYWRESTILGFLQGREAA
ncbi:MAG: AlpA family phage regulatory protein [Rhodospirillaceae bacterium]|jgi:predicted DNA-binding transcriptional regulator AlpA|nr:AlpA family phage regulatory protein [Rhodospirillaceae bacterium]